MTYTKQTGSNSLQNQEHGESVTASHLCFGRGPCIGHTGGLESKDRWDEEQDIAVEFTLILKAGLEVALRFPVRRRWHLAISLSYVVYLLSFSIEWCLWAKVSQSSQSVVMGKCFYFILHWPGREYWGTQDAKKLGYNNPSREYF